MDVNVILYSGAALGAIGSAAAVMLAAAAKVFYVHEDPRIAAVQELLPGANCGSCGFPGCAGFAAALVKGEAKPSLCSPASPAIINQVAGLLGVEAGACTHKVVRVLCQGHRDNCRSDAVYVGVNTCRGVTSVRRQGTRACPSACEGLGDCARVCVFDAIQIGANGLPQVDETRCNGCGTCAKTCPKGILHVEPAATSVWIACHTSLSAKQVKDACQRGCIGCKVCVRACPYDAIEVQAGTVPMRDVERCVNCGLCVEACKFKSIVVTPGWVADPAVRAEAEARAAERKAAKRKPSASAAEGA